MAAELGIGFAVSAPSARVMPAAVDVVVPVYRGLELTRRCINSVLTGAVTTPFELVVIDDASPEPELSRWLRAAAAEGRLTLLENPSNLGFVATVNRGMQLHRDRDVVLLNSDTEVANDWLDRLVACAYRAPDVATVTPFSNNATICSYPFEGWGGGVPGMLGLAALDRLFAQENAGKSVELPTAVGFCMYIKRRCLDAIGLFDADRFGRGYGEENDFCLRAARAGWRNVLAADVFVFHEGGASFGGEQQMLQKEAMATLLQAHPHYLELVHEFIRLDPARPLRRAIDHARESTGPAEVSAVADEQALERRRVAAAQPRDERPTRLHVTHGWGGGVGRWVTDFCRADRAHRSLVLRSCTDRHHAAYRFELVDPECSGAPLAVVTPAAPIRTTAPNHEEYRAIVGAVIRQHAVREVVVSSFVGHSLDVLDIGLPTLVVLHDMYPFCPALFACFDAPCLDCGAEKLRRCLECNPHNVFWHSSTVDDWVALRRQYPVRLTRPWISVVAPTRSIRDRWIHLMPSLAQLPWHLVPHGIDASRFPVGRPAPAGQDPGTKLRVVVPGRLTPAKGLELLRAALPGVLEVADLLLLGCGEFGAIFEGRAGIRVVRDYPNARLAEEIGTFAPHCALLLSLVPESFSYTLSELQALRVPVVATRLGALAERIDDRHTGVLVDARPDALVDCVRRLAADRGLLAEIAANLSRSAPFDVGAMVLRYNAILAGLAAAEALHPCPAPNDEPIAVGGPPAPVQDEGERNRNQVRGTFYLPDVTCVVAGFLATDSNEAAVRMIEAAAACTSVRNDVCVLLAGLGERQLLSLPNADQAIRMRASRRLFLADGVVSRARLLLAADALLTTEADETVHQAEVDALRAAQLVLTFDRDPLSRRARSAGQIGLLSDGNLAAQATAALRYWLGRRAEERARVAANTRCELEAVDDRVRREAIVAIVVTYNPDTRDLQVLLEALAMQVDRIVVIDNGSTPALGEWLRTHAPGNVEATYLEQNRGVAAAQNVGIARARELGADLVLLSDQDSLPEPEMVDRLLSALRDRQQTGEKVAAVGPQYWDPRCGAGSFVRLRGLRYQHLTCRNGLEVLQADHLIASGCLIPMAVLDEVGGMAEELFIDYVDTEWALRARRAGYRCFGVCAAKMKHERGDSPRIVFNRLVPMHEPRRHYYQYRNAVWLCRQPWLPLRWKLANVVRLLRNVAVYTVLPGPRLGRLQMATLGAWDGLRGRMGRGRFDRDAAARCGASS